METYFLNLLPTYVPFLVQCTDSDGTVTNPTLAKLVIYEEDGADATFISEYVDNAGKIGTATIGGSTIGTLGATYTPTQVNSKTGLYGKMIPKSIFTAGKYYVFLWEFTIDSIVTAMIEKYFFSNTGEFKTS